MLNRIKYPKLVKRVCIGLMLISTSNAAVAQAKSSYNQYILNNFILNPAQAGIENYTDVKISARDQWVGLNGAPKTTYFSIMSAYYGEVEKKKRARPAAALFLKWLSP